MALIDRDGIMEEISIRVVRGTKDKTLASFMDRDAFSDRAESVARKVLADIRKHGDPAVLKWSRRFDGIAMAKLNMLVKPAELHDARASVRKSFRRAVNESISRIERFAAASARKNWWMRTPGGGKLGEQYVPLERVGVYVPGGAAPLASTALMTAVIARAAGVREIVACTPAGRDGKINPYLLYALQSAGASEIYRVGGIQAIGMMAYGTRTVKKVQKIVGPGGTFVTAAKRQVYGYVGLDLVAGPSEIAVLADETADAGHVAADLLSQLEHGTGWEKALLVTTSRKLAEAVRLQLAIQSATLSRSRIIRRTMKSGMLIAVVGNLDEAVDVCNRFAPEHMEVLTSNPRRLLVKINCAGAVFLGRWTPESAGDFVAGPSHVLPTGGAARMFSGLTTDDFRRRSSIIEFTRRDLEKTLNVIEEFGRVEGLDAHVRSAKIRFEKK